MGSVLYCCGLWRDVFEAPVTRFKHERRGEGPDEPHGGKHQKYGGRTACRLDGADERRRGGRVQCQRVSGTLEPRNPPA